MLQEFSEPKLLVTVTTVLTAQPDVLVGASVSATVGAGVAAVGAALGLLVRAVVGAIVGAAVIGAAVVPGPEPPPKANVSTADLPLVKLWQYFVPSISIYPPCHPSPNESVQVNWYSPADKQHSSVKVCWLV
jgi:hypothetical protein